MLIGEKPPPWAPWITSRPIISGLIPYCRANCSATGARIATAAGLTAPTAVRQAATVNMIQGIAAMRPRTMRTAEWTRKSMVPFFCAIAKR